MITEIIKEIKEIIKFAKSKLNGRDKRLLYGKIAIKYGRGSQVILSKELKISRNTIRKGIKELESGIEVKDAFEKRGAKSALKKFPNLEKDIREIADGQSQTDPQFKSTRLYTRLSAKEIRNQLIESNKYTNQELPKDRTFNTIANKLGYNLKRVQKTKPIKKIKETNAIFENLAKEHIALAYNDDVIRISIDSKDKVKIGEFSRGGTNRVVVKASDHDFADESITPFGILNVKTGEIEISMTETKVTADYIADRIVEYWEKEERTGCSLFINADNGPENSSKRTQFIKRMVDFSMEYDVKVILAYYPPYHSKYNPIERVWGALEQHWNGDLMDCSQTILKFAESMTYNKIHPIVKLIEKQYKTGVKLTKSGMLIYEKAIDRLEGISKWFVTINPEKARSIFSQYT